MPSHFPAGGGGNTLLVFISITATRGHGHGRGRAAHITSSRHPVTSWVQQQRNPRDSAGPSGHHTELSWVRNATRVVSTCPRPKPHRCR